MKTLRLAILSIAITCLFGLTYSEGFEITSMSVENGASGCYVSLTTDEDIDLVYWYIKQESDYERVHTSTHGPGTRSVYENIGYLSGSPFGKSYTIVAIAIRRVFNPLTKVPIELSRSDSYDLTVYSSPKTKTITGSWTMAELYASIDVGWNGHTAEVTAEASVKSYSLNQIGYGLNLFYWVVRLRPSGQWAGKIWNQPPGLAKDGGLQAEEGSFAITEPYSKSDSMDTRGVPLQPGRYLLQGQITASANRGKKFDFLSVPDSEELTVPENE